MPDIFLNPEVDTCKTEDHMSSILKRTLDAYIKIRNHIGSFTQAEGSFQKIAFYYDKGNVISFFTLIKKVGKDYNDYFKLLTEDINKGNSITPPKIYAKTLKGIDVPSPFLEHAFNQRGMALSFATNEYWENDFIEFNEDNAQLPNIWGQTNFDNIHKWLDNYYCQENRLYEAIQNSFNVEFCCKDIKPSTFNPYEWEMIYDTFKKAHEKNFERTDKLIKDWVGLSPMRYIRDRNHSDFTIRIFFIKKNNKIYVGQIYHKNTINTLKEEAAAEKSFNTFKKLNIFCSSSD